MIQDNAKTRQDALSAGLGSETTSDSKSKLTSDKAKGKVYSPEDIRKLQSDAQAAEGRKWKQVERERDQAQKDLATLTSRLDEIEQTNRARAYEEARTDPSGNALRTLQAETSVREREKKAQQREAEIARDVAQLNADREAWLAESGETMVSVVAAKHGVDPAALADLGITDRAILEKVAVKLKASTPVAHAETKESDTEEYEATFSPLDETPSGGKAVELTPEGVESADMGSLEQVLAPPIK